MPFHSGLINSYFNRSCLILLCSSGCLLADIVSVSPDKVDNGNVPLGLSRLFEAGLYNGTHKPLSISSVNVTGSATGDFTLLYNACPAMLGAGQTCPIGVYFSPTQLGAETGVLTIVDDANNSPQKVKLSGVGIAPALVSIRVSPESALTLLGQTQQFTATGNYSNGSSQDLTSSVAWTVSAPNIATISATGLATAIAPGVTGVFASFAGTVGNASISGTQYSITGSMATGRAEHTATTLNNGKVLVMGGFSEFQALPVPEVYDPASGTFSLTGSASTNRYSHTATLLQKRAGVGRRRSRYLGSLGQRRDL